MPGDDIDRRMREALDEARLAVLEAIPEALQRSDRGRSAGRQAHLLAQAYALLTETERQPEAAPHHTVQIALPMSKIELADPRKRKRMNR